MAAEGGLDKQLNPLMLDYTCWYLNGISAIEEFLIWSPSFIPNQLTDLPSCSQVLLSEESM